MKTLLFVVVCSLFLASLCNATSGGASATIPLFAWSGSNVFSAQNEQILNTVEQTDIENLFNTLLGVNSKKDFAGKTIQSTPNAVVLFVEPQLQTDQIPHYGSAYATTSDGGAFSSLKSLIESSTSSLVAPYATAGVRFSLLNSILAGLVGKVPVALVREEGSSLFLELSKKEGVNTISHKDLKNTQEFSGLIVVCLDKATGGDIAAHGEIISSVSQLVSSVTSGNYAGIYTGDSASSDLLWKFPNPNAALFAQSEFASWESLPQARAGNSTYKPHTYMTGTMLEVFMVVLGLLVMVFVGICNICALQTPEQYETPKSHHQKTM